MRPSPNGHTDNAVALADRRDFAARTMAYKAPGTTGLPRETVIYHYWAARRRRRLIRALAYRLLSSALLLACAYVLWRLFLVLAVQQ